MESNWQWVVLVWALVAAVLALATRGTNGVAHQSAPGVSTLMSHHHQDILRASANKGSSTQGIQHASDS